MAEERQVSWDGYVSFDGVLYGLPSRADEPPLAGSRVQVSAWQGQLTVWQQGQMVLQVSQRARRGMCVPHPDQFRTVVPAAAARRAHLPLGHQIPAPAVAQRPLSEYDRLCGVSGAGGAETTEHRAAWVEVAG